MIAMVLEVAGFDTPAAHAFMNQGESHSSKRKELPSNHWNPTSVGKILRSLAMMGLKLTGRSVKARKIARDGRACRSGRRWTSGRSRRSARTAPRPGRGAALRPRW
ncbi:MULTISPECIES: hypothetical protein [Streptomycetaceae]|uniref:hypothetical protein n=1 Tax=Streptomycetaceae TaxID=2062 RepID=UPI001161358C|nr:hypothetical protein [Streptomyces sp. CB02056]